MADTTIPGLPSIESVFPDLAEAQDISAATHERTSADTISAGEAYMQSLEGQFDTLKTNTANTLSELDDIDRKLAKTYETRDNATDQLRDIRGMPRALSNLRVLLGDEKYSGPAQQTRINEANADAQDLEVERRGVTNKHGLVNTLLQAEGAKSAAKYNHIVKSGDLESEASDKAVNRIIQKVGVIESASRTSRSNAAAKREDMKRRIEGIDPAILLEMDTSQGPIAYEGMEFPSGMIAEEQSRVKTRDLTLDTLTITTRIAVQTASARAAGIEGQASVAELSGMKADIEIEARRKDPEAFAKLDKTTRDAASAKAMNEMDLNIQELVNRQEDNFIASLSLNELTSIRANDNQVKLPDGTIKLIKPRKIEEALQAAQTADDLQANREYDFEIMRADIPAISRDITGVAKKLNTYLPGRPEMMSEVSAIAATLEIPADPARCRQ